MWLIAANYFVCCTVLMVTYPNPEWAWELVFWLRIIRTLKCDNLSRCDHCSAPHNSALTAPQLRLNVQCQIMQNSRLV